MNLTRVWRTRSWRGQQVMVVSGNQTVSGSLDGWGERLIRVRDDSGRVHSLPRAQTTVYVRPHPQDVAPRPDLTHPYVD